jgi:hypothetical protein
MTHVHCELNGSYMQVVTKATENRISSSSIALVHKEGHFLLEDDLNSAEQKYCAAVISKHLETVSGEH